MKGYLDGELGMISIDSEVIARYAGSTAVECFGIVGIGTERKIFENMDI